MSKLAQMQARFQQKQMQEKEEKLLKLYENQQQRVFERVGRGSAGSNTSVGSTGGGKVRQMFDERRQKAGVDKSYPLEPLKAKTSVRGSGPERNMNTTSRTVVKTTVRKTVSQINNGKPVVRENVQKSYNNNYKNGTYEEESKIDESYDNIDSHNNLIDMINSQSLNDDLDNEEMPQIGLNDDFNGKPLYMTGKLSNVGGKLPSQMVETRNKMNVNGLNQRNGENKQATKVQPKIPPAKTNPSPPRTSSTTSSASSQSSRSSPARSVNSMSSKQNNSRAPTNTRPSAKQQRKAPIVRDDLAECRFCGRRFATDRLGVHEDICGKTGKKKRKIFDSTKHRVQGTELETYVIPGGKKVPSKKINTNHQDRKHSSKLGAPPKNNWRRTHEEFIAAIRAAKQAQNYVAQGGKLSDLPPPPPSSNPDYVQCPHCGRKFNEGAAQRHIPKCATYQFNKPKGVQKGRKNF